MEYITQYFLVFIEGIISFFSPCVLPLIPIYVGYLSGTKIDKKKMLINTVCFVCGISTAFFILGISFTALSKYLFASKDIFIKIAGIIILLLGLFELGFLKIDKLEKTYKMKNKSNLKNINPLIAYVLGFTFSFAWTPCVGPTLSSVILLASTEKSAIIAVMYIIIYTLGYIIPFIILGIFTETFLKYLKEKRNIFAYVVKLSGIILICIGLYTIFKAPANTEKPNIEQEKPQVNAQQENILDFKLKALDGKEYTLSQFKGKKVFINFFATWCPPCKGEMPHIQTIYEENSKNAGDIIVITIANPRGSDASINKIREYINENKYTFPVLLDETGDVFRKYDIASFPTTYIINEKGEIENKIVGGMTLIKMRSLLKWSSR
ncbi:MAG: cytochrome c biogenesis protein CcdA [Clostridia bacterium]